MAKSNRRFANVDGGYWVIDPTPRWLGHVQFTQIDAGSDLTILGMSDGFRRLIDLYGRYDDQGLFDAARDKGLSAMLQELRAVEFGDPDAKIYPRLKLADDATAFLARVI